MAFLMASTFPVAVASISARFACGCSGFTVGGSGFTTSATGSTGFASGVGADGCDCCE
jgi:hypothetical protein